MIEYIPNSSQKEKGEAPNKLYQRKDVEGTPISVKNHQIKWIEVVEGTPQIENESSRNQINEMNNRFIKLQMDEGSNQLPKLMKLKDPN